MIDDGFIQVQVAEELRENVYKATGLTCSAGIAPIRLLAKIGGIGKLTKHIIKDVFEIKTCEDLLQKSSFLCALFSPSSTGLRLGGTDPPNVRSRKSISNERTFSATKNEAFFNQKSVELADMLSADVEKECLHGRTFTLKLKTASFEINPNSARG
ncbi:hypothetical protein L2E82_35699 [Cichorium intybus]|uniref:Uncharacterized protein n=1 Tax=Cichorium intybus TaxID=13427 RepID=A0ACB9BPM6_CICIN|nr:hypothetical protein L2E82_35699 [Cichorium intybus]